MWGEVPHAWHGLAVPEFPNMFLVYGPNTFGGSGSAIYMIESQIRHVGGCSSWYVDDQGRDPTNCAA